MAKYVAKALRLINDSIAAIGWRQDHHRHDPARAYELVDDADDRRRIAANRRPEVLRESPLRYRAFVLA